jgi:aryl-alcohol dehydrogenase-like predicted oxidoreductase
MRTFGTFNRRQLVKGAMGLAAASWWTLHQQDLLRAAVAPVGTAGGKDAPKGAGKRASDRVILGKTGIKLSRLAMGSGTNGVGKSSQQSRLGVYGFADLLEHAFDRGVNFFETADQYGTHEHMREGMRRVGKNNVVLLTKTHADTAKELEADLERFRRELGRDHLDIVLLHCMTSPTWTKDKEGAMEALARAKEKGIIRAHGVSCHTLPALELAARTPWVDVDLARINPIGASMDADPETVLKVLAQMKQAGKGIIGMKILGAGALAKQVDRAIAFAGKLDVLDTFTIGFGSPKQFDEIADKLPRLSQA